MLRGSDVPEMMTRVELLLARTARTPAGSGGYHFVNPDGDSEDLQYLRRSASIEIEFHSGSARPVFGAVVRMGKRAVRRGLRWYLGPIMEQQSRFNHMTIDLLERARLENERLRARLDALAGDEPPAVAEPGPSR